MRKLRTYSCAPVRIPSLCRRELGSIEPHQRGEGLRHPVGDHRHGAEHDADLQQRHRHLCTLLGFYLSRLHSTDSGEKRARRVMLPRSSCGFTRDSGSDGLFLDISKEALGSRTTVTERSGSHSGRVEKPKAAAGRVLTAVDTPLAVLSRTLLPLRFTVTIWFTPDGPPPASVRSVMKCHRLHTRAAPNG